MAFTDLKEDDNFKNTEKELQSYGVKAKGYISDASDFAQSAEFIDAVAKISVISTSLSTMPVSPVTRCFCV